MGEAKRRKKLMGEDYGKKRQLIVRGIEDLERHLLKLGKAWDQQMSEKLGYPLNLQLPLTEFQFKKSQCQEWLKNYLEMYSDETQQQLVEGFLDIHYQSFYQVYEKIKEGNKDPNLRKKLTVKSVPLMFYYSCYQDYLDDNLKELYRQPIAAMNESIWQEMLNNQKEIEEAGTENISQVIGYLIQDCLDFSENAQDSPEETLSKNQDEPLFYK